MLTETERVWARMKEAAILLGSQPAALSLKRAIQIVAALIREQETSLLFTDEAKVYYAGELLRMTAEAKTFAQHGTSPIVLREFHSSPSK